MGRYEFADADLERYSFSLALLSPLFIAIIVSLGPHCRPRTVALSIFVPLAIVCTLGSCLVATNFSEYPEETLSEIKVGPVTYGIKANCDITYRPISSTWLHLEMTRPVLNGILKEGRTLFELEPADKADIHLVDNGKYIEFTSPALLGRKPVSRKFSTDWNTACKSNCEIVRLTADEQGAAALAEIKAYNNH